MRIRPYDGARDYPEVRACLVELQDHERALDPRMPEGSAIAEPYLDLMFARCREFAGQVLVADVDGAVVGFVCVWAAFRSREPDDDPAPYAFVSDLCVLAAFRQRGFGRELLAHAESFARAHGARALRIGVRARNEGAMRLYARAGFEPFELQLEKRLA